MSKQSGNFPDPEDLPTNGKPTHPPKPKAFILEYRLIPEMYRGIFKYLWAEGNPWKVYKRYKKLEDRDQAFKILNRKADLFEYRIPQD